MEVIITIIVWAAVLQGLLLGLIFIISKKYRSFANQLLGFFLLTFVFAALTDLLPFYEIWGYSISGYFTLPEVKLLFPVLFLHFVLEKVGRSQSYALFLKIHYLLGFGIIGITLINLAMFLISANSLLALLGWEFLDRFFMSQQYYAFLLTVGIFVISIKETLQYRNLIRNEFTDMALLDINWLWQCILGISPIILFWGAELVRIMLGGVGQSDLTIVAYLFIAIFNYFVSFKAFTQQTLFDGSADTWRTIAKTPIISDRSTAAIDGEICDLIKRKMETKEYFLNQNLTIHDFSKEIKISARTISTCINQNMRLNFNEWVNNYRVETALKMIHSDSKNLLSIEGIGMDSGFKSRSAMYAAFKKKTGHSPGHFRSV
jgi:AraC-like DNA-binding protein